jgi:molecular chaperone HtpG
MEQHTWKIQLDGLLKLIAGPLYRDRDVFVRELVQNAHDSIRKRRRLEEGSFTPEIRWTADAAAGTLRIRDNGAGLTRDEIHRYLSTVGRSGTAELKQSLHSTEFIGQHGIGFLSAFSVADRVEVFTRSRDEGGLHWASEGGNEYGIEGIGGLERGTEVLLHLNREQRRFLGETVLAAIVRRYADIIGLPVYIGDAFAPANRVYAPWRQPNLENPDTAWLDLFHSRFDGEHPLVWWPVDLPFLYLDETTESPREGRARGLLAVSDRSVPGFNTGAAVEVFISGMMVANRASEVLPQWASFVLGMIECDVLQPNAARDGLVAGEALSSLRTSLGAFLMEELADLGRTDPERLEDVLRWHAYEILGMSLQKGNEPFFDLIAPVMPLATARGPRINLGGLWDSSPGQAVTVRYSTERPGEQMEDVVDASGAFVEEFLVRAARQWPARLRVERLDAGDVEDRLEELSDREGRWLEPALSALREAAGNIQVRAARLHDSAVPALLAAPGETAGGRELQMLADDVRMPAGLRRAVRNFTASRHETRVLWLNADHPCAQTMSQAQAGPHLRAAAALVFQTALLAGAANLPAAELKQAYGGVEEAVRLLLSV